MTMTLHDLQVRSRNWLLHNFPKQLKFVEKEDIKKNVKALRSTVTRGGQIIECDIDDVCAALAKQINDGDLGRTDSHGFFGIVEELGELAHAYLKHEQGIRGYDLDTAREAMGDAMADMIIFMCSFCNTHGFDLQAEVEKAWAEVETRDWKKYPDTGRPPAITPE